MLAISNESMDISIGDPEIQTLLIGTDIALSVHALPASDFAPGAYRWKCWPYHRRGSGGETTGGAIVWATGLEETVEGDTLGPAS